MPNFLETSGGPLAGLATLVRGGMKNSVPLPMQLMLSLYGNKSLSPAFSKGGSMGFLGLNRDKQRQGQTAQPTQYANTQMGATGQMGQMGQMGQPQPQGQYAGTQVSNPYYQQYQVAQQAMNPQGGM